MVVIQEIFGVNEYVRRTADRFAAEGYVVLAPDLFWRIKPGIDLGYSAEEWQQAFGLFGTFDVDKGIDDIAATIDALRNRDDEVGGVGCVGFCLGGKLAYLTAARTDVDCAVSYYGVGMDAHAEEASAVTVPIVFHMAELDEYAPASSREALIAAFDGNAQASFFVYAGQDHAFAREEGEHYDEASTALAYGRTMNALHTALSTA
jgi:carboxymethylenebutenolidase